MKNAPKNSLEYEKVIQKLKVNQLGQHMTQEALEENKKILTTLEEAKQDIEQAKMDMLTLDDGDSFENLFDYFHEDEKMASYYLEECIQDARETIKDYEETWKRQKAKEDELLDLLVDMLVEEKGHIQRKKLEKAVNEFETISCVSDKLALFLSISLLKKQNVHSCNSFIAIEGMMLWGRLVAKRFLIYDVVYCEIETATQEDL